MFVSTREMLGQTLTDRASAETVIREFYGSECNVEKALRELSICSALNNLGLGAFSDEALRRIASILKEEQQRIDQSR
jgi:hypothetical protein